MNPTISLVRAVGTEFARRSLRPLVIAGLIVAIILVCVGAWLTTISAWWWIVEAVVISATLLLVFLIVIARTLLRIVEPPLSKAQKAAVTGFVDKLQRATDSLHTPYPVIIFYIVRDIVRPRQDGFIATVSQDSKTLAPDLAKLRKMFG